jgi:hypothetical protein
VLKCFSGNIAYPGVSIIEKYQDGKISPFKYDIIDLIDNDSMFDQNEHYLLTMTFDNLVRQGIVIKNYNILQINYNYDSFKEHWQYKRYMITVKNDSKVEMKKFRIELTELGRALTKCCLDE